MIERLEVRSVLLEVRDRCLWIPRFQCVIRIGNDEIRYVRLPREPIQIGPGGVAILRSIDEETENIVLYNEADDIVHLLGGGEPNAGFRLAQERRVPEEEVHRRGADRFRNEA